MSLQRRRRWVPSLLCQDRVAKPKGDASRTQQQQREVAHECRSVSRQWSSSQVYFNSVIFGQPPLLVSLSHSSYTLVVTQDFLLNPRLPSKDDPDLTVFAVGISLSSLIESAINRRAASSLGPLEAIPLNPRLHRTVIVNLDVLSNPC